MNPLSFRIGVAVVVVVAVGMVAPAAWAATGTIRSIAPGGAAGSIVVSEVSGLMHETTPGDIIMFNDPALPGLGLHVGDRVTFEIITDPPSPPHGELATNLTRLSEGTIIVHDLDCAVDVGPGASMVITGGATINGKISLNGGTLLVLDGVTVDSKIESGDGGCLYIESAAKVDGKIQSNGATCLTVLGTPRIEGKISSNGDAFVQIRNNTINGKLEVIGATTCKVSGNTVSGKVNAPGCTP